VISQLMPVSAVLKIPTPWHGTRHEVLCYTPLHIYQPK